MAKKSKKIKRIKKKRTGYTKHSRRPFLILLFSILLLALIAMLGFSVYSYQTSNQEEEGFFACNNDGTICELSQHIHADIEVTVCEKEIEFEKEKGNVNLQHTHKETNKIHWHARLNVDPKTKEPLDPAPPRCCRISKTDGVQIS